MRIIRVAGLALALVLFLPVAGSQLGVSASESALAGSLCSDGWMSPSQGSGTCSWHGGISGGGSSQNNWNQGIRGNFGRPQTPSWNQTPSWYQPPRLELSPIRSVVPRRPSLELTPIQPAFPRVNFGPIPTIRPWTPPVIRSVTPIAPLSPIVPRVPMQPFNPNPVPFTPANNFRQSNPVLRTPVTPVPINTFNSGTPAYQTPRSDSDIALFAFVIVGILASAAYYVMQNRQKLGYMLAGASAEPFRFPSPTESGSEDTTLIKDSRSTKKSVRSTVQERKNPRT
jgi:hypothetical protein